LHRNDVHLLFAPVAMVLAILVATWGGPLVQVAVLVLLVGAALRWPAPVARLHPAMRAVALFGLFFVLQAGWYLGSGTTYGPACRIVDPLPGDAELQERLAGSVPEDARSCSAADLQWLRNGWVYYRNPARDVWPYATIHPYSPLGRWIVGIEQWVHPEW
jgi:hypothetical protein